MCFMQHLIRCCISVTKFVNHFSYDWSVTPVVFVLLNHFILEECLTHSDVYVLCCGLLSTALFCSRSGML